MNLESVLSKYKRLNIQPADTESVSTDSELEEVCDEDVIRQCDTDRMKREVCTIYSRQCL